METPMADPSLGGKAVIQTHWLQRSGLFIVYLVCALAIHLLGSNFFNIFPNILVIHTLQESFESRKAQVLSLYSRNI